MGRVEDKTEAKAKLKEALGRNLFRVVDLFTRWDVDCDHTISKEELRLALNSLGVPFDEQTLQALFIELDADRSGDVDFEELHGDRHFADDVAGLHRPQRLQTAGQRPRGRRLVLRARAPQHLSPRDGRRTLTLTLAAPVS